MKYKEKFKLISDWSKIFSNTLIANTILNRLVHHTSIISILGNFYRTAIALSKLRKKSIENVNNLF